MKNKIEISASIVLYNENMKDLGDAIHSFLNTNISKKLYLIDNTEESRFLNKFNFSDIEYISVGKNIGFGAGHNRIINSIKHLSKYHLILNPDVSFGPKVIPNLIAELESNDTAAMIAPRVLFPDGSHQYSCRRYPKAFELFARRFQPFSFLFKRAIDKGIYKDKDLSRSFFAEYLTGCFQLYNTEDFILLNGFDERYFLYMEDVDICKKIDQMNKQKIYFPKETITHVLKKDSEKKIKLFFRHIFSMLKYFNKWR